MEEKHTNSGGAAWAACEVGLSEFLMLERLAMHENAKSAFGEHCAFADIAPAWWEKRLTFSQAAEWCESLGVDFLELRNPKRRGDAEQYARAVEAFGKGLSLYGLIRAETIAKDRKRDKAKRRKWCQTVAFFATDCTVADVCEIVDRTPAQVMKELHDTWYDDFLLGCIDEIARDAYWRGVIVKPIEEIGEDPFGPVQFVELSWAGKQEAGDAE